jgi:hypothetical protein
MPIVACPHCGTKLDAPESVLGKEVVCGQCSNRFVAAAMGAAEAGAGPAQPETPGPAGEFGEPLGPETMPSETPSAPGAEVGGPPSGASPPEPGVSPPGPTPPPPGAIPPPPWAAAPGQIPPAPVPPPPGAYGAPQPFGQPQMPKPSGNATAALTLGIISLVCGCCCWPGGLICGILAIVFSNRAVGDIQAGLADPDSAGKARAGKICGLIGLVLSIIGAVVFVINLSTGGSPFEVNF